LCVFETYTLQAATASKQNELNKIVKKMSFEDSYDGVIADLCAHGMNAGEKVQQIDKNVWTIRLDGQYRLQFSFRENAIIPLGICSSDKQNNRRNKP